LYVLLEASTQRAHLKLQTSSIVLGRSVALRGTGFSLHPTLLHLMCLQLSQVVQSGTLQGGWLQRMQRIFRVALVLLARALLEKIATSFAPHRLQVVLFFVLVHVLHRPRAFEASFHARPSISF